MKADNPVKTANTPRDLTGERGLLASVIARAARDAGNLTDLENYIDSWTYLRGDSYGHHLDLLGLEQDMVPTMIAEMPLDQIAQGNSALYRSALHDQS